MTSLTVACFVIPAPIALAFSVWLPARVPLGTAFWILTAMFTAPALMAWTMFLLVPRAPDPYGYGSLAIIPIVFVISPIALGWLFGVAVVLTIRCFQRRGGGVTA